MLMKCTDFIYSLNQLINLQLWHPQCGLHNSNCIYSTLLQLYDEVLPVISYMHCAMQWKLTPSPATNHVVWKLHSTFISNFQGRNGF